MVTRHLQLIKGLSKKYANKLSHGRELGTCILSRMVGWKSILNTGSLSETRLSPIGSILAGNVTKMCEWPPDGAESQQRLSLLSPAEDVGRGEPHCLREGTIYIFGDPELKRKDDFKRTYLCSQNSCIVEYTNPVIYGVKNTSVYRKSKLEGRGKG